MGQQYINKNNLYDRFGQIEIDGYTDGDDDKLNAVITSACAVVDGYVAPRYRLPLTNQHEVLKDAACDIVYYKLQTIQPTETARKNYEDALMTLSRISKGTMTLNEPTGEESKPRSKIYIRKNPRKFTMKMWGDC